MEKRRYIFLMLNSYSIWNLICVPKMNSSIQPIMYRIIYSSAGDCIKSAFEDGCSTKASNMAITAVHLMQNKLACTSAVLPPNEHAEIPGIACVYYGFSYGIMAYICSFIERFGYFSIVYRCGWWRIWYDWFKCPSIRCKSTKYGCQENGSTSWPNFLSSHLEESKPCEITQPQINAQTILLQYLWAILAFCGCGYDVLRPDRSTV